MVFSCPPGPPPFVATINDSNAVFLDGISLPITQVARPASSLPLDLSLWHRRLAHHHLEGVRMLYKHDMVTGMKLDVSTSPDQVCEACLAGKMHATPFCSSEWRASHPLELVHTDVHMLPYRTLSGHCYWVTLIDDYSRYCFVTPIAAKSDVFEAFNRFKAFAENQSERKLKTLRNDKGDEYMSNAMAKFTAHCGNSHQHTVRPHPQQNGVAERANRLLSECITAILDELGLAKLLG